MVGTRFLFLVVASFALFLLDSLTGQAEGNGTSQKLWNLTSRSTQKHQDKSPRPEGPLYFFNVLKF